MFVSLFRQLQMGRNGQVGASALFNALRSAHGPDRYERYAALDDGKADIGTWCDVYVWRKGASVPNK